MPALEWLLSFFVLGGFVGFVAGLLGVGGGGILVPILSSLFLLKGMPTDTVVHMALGTSMACIVSISISSLHAHHKRGGVIWKIVGTMSVGVTLGTLLSTYIASFFSSLYLALFFSLFMGFTAKKMMENKRGSQVPKSLNTTGMLVSSAGIGAVSALVSIGGGSLTVPYLVANNIDIKKAIGTSAALGFPISFFGTVGYLYHGWHQDTVLDNAVGFVYLPAVLLISIASYFTTPIGVKASHHLPIDTLKKLFALLLIIMSLKMLLSIILIV